VLDHAPDHGRCHGVAANGCGAAYARAMSDDSWLLAGPTSPDEVRRHYDEWSPDYDDTLRGWGYEAPARAARLLLDRAGGGAHVLDAGCGTGLVGAALRAGGHRGGIVGADLSERSLVVARARGVYHEVVAADLHATLPFDAGRFDAVVCVGVLTYVPDTEAIWREFARVVRPGGWVVCTQRSDVWTQRACDQAAQRLERDGTWTVALLTPPLDYLPGNPDFGRDIGVRYLAARV
jgi:methyltransferase-like protein 27